jgi:serine/alanine adding enzyme
MTHMVTPATGTSSVSAPSVQVFEGSPAEWDDFVRAQSGARHFHLFGWRRVVEMAYGHDCISLETRDSRGALTGVLQLAKIRSPMFGDFLVSMPFVDYGGPLGSDVSVRTLSYAASSLMGSRTLLELRSAIPLPLATTASHRKVAVVKPLTGGVDETWKALRSQVRVSVRKAQKAGVTVRFGADQAETFHSLFAYRMRDLGTPAHSKRWFQAIASVFPESAWIGCAYLGDTAIAGACGFELNGELHLLHASQLDAHRTIQPNMLLTWAFIERAIGAGITRFNFGRSTPGTPAHEFKRRWGGVDETLYWYDVHNGGVAKTPSPNDSAYALGPRIWKRLPRPVATALGPYIVKYIP